MIREFGKSNDTTPIINDATPVIIETRPRDNTVLLDEPAEGMRPFHVEVENEETNNTAKMVGGVLVALLLAGGGIYAYEMTSHNTTGQQVALKTPTQNKAAMDQTASAPQQPATDNSAPDNSATPSAQPASTPTPPARRVIKSADKDDAGTAMASAPADTTAPAPVQQDAAINAPMTLTPDTAPAPEQSAPVGQTAMQQPLTAPNVTDQSNQPTSAVANNDLPQPSAPVVQPQLVTPDLPAPQAPTPQAATPQAQVPADQAQLPSAQ